jgi:hypothetical protein
MSLWGVPSVRDIAVIPVNYFPEDSSCYLNVLRIYSAIAWAVLSGISDQYLYRERVYDIYRVMDEVSEKYGKHSLHLGASHFIEVFGRGKRGEPTAREKTCFPGETKRRHLSIPILHVKV